MSLYPVGSAVHFRLLIDWQNRGSNRRAALFPLFHCSWQKLVLLLLPPLLAAPLSLSGICQSLKKRRCHATRGRRANEVVERSAAPPDNGIKYPPATKNEPSQGGTSWSTLHSSSVSVSTFLSSMWPCVITRHQYHLKLTAELHRRRRG